MASVPAIKSRTAAPRNGRSPSRAEAADTERNGTESRHDLPPLRHFVGYAIRRAQLRIYEDFFDSMESEGITPGRFTALMLIRHTPGIRSTDLARALRIARSGVVKLLTYFEQQGLVRREATDGDRRAQCLELTAHGKERLAYIEARVEEHDQRICGGLSTAERVQLLDLLSRVARKP